MTNHTAAGMYRVFDMNAGKASYIGSYFAKNEKHAIQSAQRDLLEISAGFRKSCPAIALKDPRALLGSLEDARAALKLAEG